MKDIYSLDTWILFVLIVLPIALQQTFIGPVIEASFFFASVFWFFRVSADLFKKLPVGHKLKMNVFRFHFYFPLIYFPVIIFLYGGHSISLPLKDTSNRYVSGHDLGIKYKSEKKLADTPAAPFLTLQKTTLLRHIHIETNEWQGLTPANGNV